MEQKSPRPGIPLPPQPGSVGATALAVAAARATEGLRSAPLFDDPIAAAFVAAAGWPGWLPVDPADRASPLGDYIAVRTRFFDDYLLAAAATGCRQVVILAAGLDARAFRLPWPADMQVYEIDRAEVLAFKETVLNSRGDDPKCTRRVVTADLALNWVAALKRAGFRPEQPTAWLAEGILMYLEAEVRDCLMRQLTRLSPAGSTLAIEGMGAGLLDSPVWQQISSSLPVVWQDFIQQVRPLIRADFPTDPAAYLAEHGWQAASFRPSDLAATYGRTLSAPFDGSSSEGWLIRAERQT